jgi:hypothetical protein
LRRAAENYIIRKLIIFVLLAICLGAAGNVRSRERERDLAGKSQEMKSLGRCKNRSEDNLTLGLK